VSNLTPNQFPPFSGSVDGVNDKTIWWQNSTSSLLSISRNQMLGITSAPLGLTDTQSPTNKTFNNTNTITVLDSGFTLQDNGDNTKQAQFSIGGNTTGTTRTYTLPNASVTIASLTGTEILTNKTLTSPTINAPIITNANITADSISGFTTASSGTIYGLSIASGAFTTANIIPTAGLQAASVTLAKMAQGSVDAAQLKATAITLGYTQITGNLTTNSATAVQATGLTASVTIPPGGRKIKITVYVGEVSDTGANGGVGISIWDGVVGSGTQLNATRRFAASTSANAITGAICMAVVTPSAGAKTYNVGFLEIGGAGNATLTASSTEPAFILVEAI
jgi:hypothetical protein